jgi:hypothetical protein
MAIGAKRVGWAGLGWAYKMILGREPSQIEVEAIEAEPDITIDVLRRHLLSSPDVRDIIAPHDPTAEQRDRRGRILEHISTDQSGSKSARVQSAMPGVGGLSLHDGRRSQS